MAFKITRKPTYKTEIKVEMPNGKGKRDVEKFMAEFKFLGIEKLDELKEKPHREVMSEVLVGWEDMVDDNGDPVEFNDLHKKALFDIPQAFDALVAGFWNSIFGAKKGN